MKRIAAIIAIAVMLVSLPAWSGWTGTWKDDFNDGILDGWQLHDFTIGRPGSWKIINGELIAIADFPLAPAMEWLLPVKPIVEQNDLTAEFRLRADTIIRGQGNFDEKKFLVGSMGMAITRRDNKKVFYSLEWIIDKDSEAWDPNFRRAGSLSIGFEDPEPFGPILPPFPIGAQLLQEQFKPAALQAKIGDWYKIKVEIKEKRVKVYWDDSLIKEFEFHVDFPVGSVGFFIFGHAIKVNFDDYMISTPGISDQAVLVYPKSKLATTWGKIKVGRQ